MADVMRLGFIAMPWVFVLASAVCAVDGHLVASAGFAIAYGTAARALLAEVYGNAASRAGR